MSKKKEINQKQMYLFAAIAFICAGFFFYFNDSTRMMSYVFPILGITFLIIGLSDKSKQGS